MKKIIPAFAYAILVLALGACDEKNEPQAQAGTFSESGAGSPERPVKLSENETYEMVVSFDEEMSEYLALQSAEGVIEAVEETFAPTKASSVATMKIARMERVFPDAGEYEELHRAAGLHKFYRLSYTLPVDREKAAGELLAMQCVETAEAPTPKKLCKVNLPFNDPYATQYQWQYYNDGTLASKFVKGCDINVVPVWKEFTGGTSNVIVAVVDEGIDANHEDLGAVMIAPGSNGSKNFVKNNYTITAGDHGCHVAGIIGAINNNRKGCCGVAGGLDGSGGVRLMSCQIFAGSSGGDSAAAIVWGADHGAVICQNSWGYNYDSNGDGKISGSEVSRARNATIDSDDKAAVDYFIKYAGCDSNGNQKSDSPMKGGVVIFAAGNDNFDNGAPANYSPVIAVGATGPDGRRATYSNYGSWVDICAPGGEDDRFAGTATANNGLSYILSCSYTKDNPPYVFMCGTSMACPMVSGVAALLVSYFGGPGFTNTQLKSMLLDNANPNIIPASDNIGPMVDAYASFKNSIHVNAAPTISTSYTGSYTVRAGATLAIDYVAEDSDGDICTFSLKGDESASLKDTGENKCRLTVDTSEKNAGSHTATLTADDGNGGTASLEVSYTISGNNAPGFDATQQNSYTVKIGETLEVELSVTDKDGDVCSFSLQGDASASLKDSGENKCRLTVNTSAIFKGSHTAIITADDGHGGKATKTISYSIVSGNSPIIKTDYTGSFNVRVGLTLEVLYTVTDEDSPNVEVTLQSDGSSTLEPLGSGRYKFAIKALQPYSGAHTAVLKADDGESEPATLTINYTIIPNTKPTITTSYSGSYTVRTGQSPVSIDYSVKDADGDRCTVSFEGDGSSDFTTLSEAQYRLTIKTDEKYAGTHKATIKADDGFGGIATKEVEYTVKLNHAPTISAKGSFDPEIAVGQDIKAYFTVADEDGDDVSLAIQGDGSVSLGRPGTNEYYLSFNATQSYVGSHTVKLIASDPYGKIAELQVSFKIYVNQPPVITKTYSGPSTLKWYETGTLVFKATDPEGKDGLKLSVSSSNPVSKATVSGITATVNVGDGKGDFAGVCTVTATATDWLGESSSEVFKYTVIENRAPLARKAIGDVYLDMTGSEVKLKLSDYFSDPDEEQLTFSCTADDGSIVSAVVNGNMVILKGLKAGVANITATATDGLGKTVSKTFRAGAFDLSGGPVIAPNPVRDSFMVRLGEQTGIRIAILSENGNPIREIEGTSSIFDPLTVNVRSLAPGRYIVKIECYGQSWTRKMTKL